MQIPTASITTKCKLLVHTSVHIYTPTNNIPIYLSIYQYNKAGGWGSKNISTLSLSQSLIFFSFWSLHTSYPFFLSHYASLLISLSHPHTCFFYIYIYKKINKLYPQCVCATSTRHINLAHKNSWIKHTNMHAYTSE